MGSETLPVLTKLLRAKESGYRFKLSKDQDSKKQRSTASSHKKSGSSGMWVVFGGRVSGALSKNGLQLSKRSVLILKRSCGRFGVGETS